jgi:hypothetical protein
MTTTAKHSYLARLYEQLVAQARRKPGQTQRAELRHGARISVTVRGSMQYVIFSRQDKPVGDTELVTFRHHLSIPTGARRLPAEGQGDSDGRQYVGYAWEVGR